MSHSVITQKAPQWDQRKHAGQWNPTRSSNGWWLRRLNHAQSCEYNLSNHVVEKLTRAAIIQLLSQVNAPSLVPSTVGYGVGKERKDMRHPWIPGRHNRHPGGNSHSSHPLKLISGKDRWKSHYWALCEQRRCLLEGCAFDVAWTCRGRNLCQRMQNMLGAGGGSAPLRSMPSHLPIVLYSKNRLHRGNTTAGSIISLQKGNIFRKSFKYTFPRNCL